jgi:lipopolysaccharide/colanic/teichoic acid biosynthesis glycosyltransferase
MLLIAVLVKLEDGKNVFFRQERLGKNKNPFVVLKFRTMRENEITKTGKWLRNTGLDELPQIFAILKGDMNVVGPRPLTTFDVQRLGWTENLHQKRWDVKPGLTGLAQLIGGQGAEQSLKADFQYIDNQSFMIDFKIISWSFLINIFGKKLIKKYTYELIF